MVTEEFYSVPPTPPTPAASEAFSVYIEGMKRISLVALTVVVLLGIAASVHWRPDRALEVASGLMARNL